MLKQCSKPLIMLGLIEQKKLTYKGMYCYIKDFQTGYTRSKSPPKDIFKIQKEFI